ncbi:MAG: CHAT domain-containing protein [Vulcanimicrobiota bacterium]
MISIPKALAVWLMLLTAPLWAQPVDVETFLNRTEQWRQAGELIKIVQGVRLYPEVARPAFDQVLAQQPDRVEWLNTIARAFRMEGYGEPEQLLKEKGMLWAVTRWRGTLFEADEAIDTRGTMATVMPAQPAAPPAQQGLAAATLAIRVGNQTYLPGLLARLKAESHDPLQVAKLELVALEGGGLWDEAIERGETMVTGLSPRDEVFVRLAVATAAHKAERPEVLDRQLVALAQLPTAPLEGFVVESLALERELQKNPDLPPAQWLARHTATWSKLDNLERQPLEGGLGRWVGEGASVWISAALRQMSSETNEFPVYAQLYYVVWEDLRRLRRLAAGQMDMSLHPTDLATFVRVWNPEFLLASQALELQVVRTWRLQGRKAEALLLLRELAAPVEATWQAIRETGLAYQLANMGSPNEFPWTQGDVARVVALYKLEKAQLEDDEQALEEALVYQNDARSGVGYLGLEDARFTQLERLAAKQPAGWAKLARPTAATLLKESESHHHRPGIIVALIRLAEVDRALGQKERALKACQRAVTLVEDYLTEAGGSAHLRQRFRRAYELQAELLLEAGKQPEAFETLARLGQAESLMSGQAEALAQSDPKLRSATRALDELRDRGQALQSEQTRGGKKAEGLVAANRQEFYTALGEIRRQHPGYGQFLSIRPVNFARIQSQVPADAVVLQTLPTKDSLYLFVLTRESLKIRQVAVSRNELDSLVKQTRRALLATQASQMVRAGRAVAQAPSNPVEGLEEALLHLHKLLIDPVEPDIADKKVLAFIPSGSLMTLPLSCVARLKDDRLEFLIERKQVVSLLKSSDLEHLASAIPTGNRRLFAIGNPDGSLPAAAEEAKSIGRQFPEATVLLGGEATLDRLQSLADNEYIHLATHGVLNARDPNSSFLVLANQQKLAISDIAGLQLDQTRLVSLSACETALGESAQDTSELTSLADAFGFAGCPTVVASLWKVSDDSTRSLMEKFYTGLLAKKSPAQALQEAQQALLADPATRHPFHWAAFTMIGDWR